MARGTKFLVIPLFRLGVGVATAAVAFLLLPAGEVALSAFLAAALGLELAVDLGVFEAMVMGRALAAVVDSLLRISGRVRGRLRPRSCEAFAESGRRRP